MTVNGTAPAADAGRRVLLQTAATSRAPWRSAGDGHGRPDGRLPRARQAASLGPDARGRAVAGTRRRGRVDRRGAPTAAKPAAHSRPSRSAPGSRRPATSPPCSAAGPVHVGGTLLPAVAGRRVRLQAQSRPRLAHARQRPHRRPRRLSPERLARRRPAGSACAWCSAATAATLARCGRPGASRCCTRRSPRGTTTPGTTGMRLSRRSRRRQPDAAVRHQGRASSYGGRTVTAVVDDRGPYVGGRDVGPQPDHRRRARLRGRGDRLVQPLAQPGTPARAAASVTASGRRPAAPGTVWR